MRIKIEIVGDITIIESFNEKGYLKIHKLGDKTNLQTTFDNKEVVKVINEINEKVFITELMNYKGEYKCYFMMSTM